LDTDRVFHIVFADRICFPTIAHTSAARLGDDGSIDCYDVAHSHEGCEPSTKFNRELGSFDLPLLEVLKINSLFDKL